VCNVDEAAFGIAIRQRQVFGSPLPQGQRLRGPRPSAYNGARQKFIAAEPRGRLPQGIARPGALARALAGEGGQDLSNSSTAQLSPGLSAGAFLLRGMAA
jgi:hypothetical protein